MLPLRLFALFLTLKMFIATSLLFCSGTLWTETKENSILTAGLFSLLVNCSRQLDCLFIIRFSVGFSLARKHTDNLLKMNEISKAKSLNMSLCLTLDCVLLGAY